MTQEALTLQVDGCWVERDGTQHYTYPRELEADALTPEELAISEYIWHLHPEWQGQFEEEMDCVDLSHTEKPFDQALEEMMELDHRPLPFPRQLWDGKNDNVLALLEWQWHTNRNGIIMELFING